MKHEQTNLLGAKVSPLTIAEWIQHANREFLAAALTGLLNPHYIILTDAGDGSGAASSDGEVIIGPNGSTITLDLRGIKGGTGSTIACVRYRVKDDLGASLSCVTWDGTTEGGSPVYVAKDTTLRNTITSEVKQGVTYSYTYSLGSADTNGNHYLVRTISGSNGSAEIDDIDPPYLFNCEIRAISIPAETLDSHSVTMIDLNCASRAWASR